MMVVLPRRFSLETIAKRPVSETSQENSIGVECSPTTFSPRNEILLMRNGFAGGGDGLATMLCLARMEVTSDISRSHRAATASANGKIAGSIATGMFMLPRGELPN